LNKGNRIDGKIKVLIVPKPILYLLNKCSVCKTIKNGKDLGPGLWSHQLGIGPICFDCNSEIAKAIDGEYIWNGFGVKYEY